MEQYLTSLDEVESRLIAAEKWIDVPLKRQDYSHLDLEVTTEGEPADYYRNMFDLVALAFDADITRSVAFMLNREPSAARRPWKKPPYHEASPTRMPRRS